jgi:hypothetical protein
VVAASIRTQGTGFAHVLALWFVELGVLHVGRKRAHLLMKGKKKKEKKRKEKRIEIAKKQDTKINESTKRGKRER